MQLPDVNLDISDLATREVVQQLLNIIEALAAENAALRVENQQLRDENARLKGGSGKPNIKPSLQPPPADHSSEAERQTRTPRGKPKKNATLSVTREERCVVDPATLPGGARFNGTRETIAQNLIPALGHNTTNVSQPALQNFLRTVGVSIGTGTIARLLGASTGRWAEEAEAIHQAGLASGPWVATDQTATRVDGQNEVCHVVGNPLFTYWVEERQLAA